MADNIEQRMRGDVDNQPQIAVRAAVFARRSLAFQTDTLTIDYPGGDLHIQRFRRFTFDHAKHVVHRQVIADGARLCSASVSSREYRHFDLQIVAAGGMLAATLDAPAGQTWRRRCRRNLAGCSSARVSAAGDRSRDRCDAARADRIRRAAATSFRTSQASARSLNLASASLSLLTSGVIFARQAAVGGLDGFQIVGWLHPKNGIIILQFP